MNARATLLCRDGDIDELTWRRHGLYARSRRRAIDALAGWTLYAEFPNKAASWKVGSWLADDFAGLLAGVEVPCTYAAGAWSCCTG